MAFLIESAPRSIDVIYYLLVDDLAGRGDTPSYCLIATNTCSKRRVNVLVVP